MIHDIVCGIYKITNKINNKVYIGQSVGVYFRWYHHKWELRNNRHFNIHLQRAWNKYGEDNFEFDIIELCLPEELYDKERFYISKYNSMVLGYNHNEGGIGWRHTDETKRKISEANKGKIYSDKTKKKMSDANKGRIVSDETKQNLSISHRNRSKEILQIDLEGNIVREWSGLYQIREELSIDTRTIGGCCKKEAKRYTYKNNIWMYKEDYEINGVDLGYYLSHKLIKEVLQYDLEMNFIKEWKDISTASEELKIKDSEISRCCKNKIKSAGNYIWKYKY